MTKPNDQKKLKRKEYESELRKLQLELCFLQDWVVHDKARAVVVFEGRDAAGKGGTIKAITERVSPRVDGDGADVVEVGPGDGGTVELAEQEMTKHVVLRSRPMGGPRRNE